MSYCAFVVGYCTCSSRASASPVDARVVLMSKELRTLEVAGINDRQTINGLKHTIDEMHDDYKALQAKYMVGCSLLGSSHDYSRPCNRH